MSDIYENQTKTSHGMLEQLMSSKHLIIEQVCNTIVCFCYSGKAKLEVTAESTIMVIKVAQTCQKSMKTGQVVNVDL